MKQCPNSDSETVLSPKTGSKLSQVHSAPNLAQPARARVCRVVGCCCSVVAPDRVTGHDGRVAGVPLAVSWPCMVVSRHSACSLAPSWSQYSPCIVTQRLPLPCHDTPDYIMTRPASQASPLSHNTRGVLRHTYPLARPVFQPWCHDTMTVS